VIDAFHIVNAAPIETRFFIDERDQRPKGIPLTDDLFRLNESIQFANLRPEVEARWRLVETAWSLNLARHLMVVSYEAETGLLVTPDRVLRRKTITFSRRGCGRRPRVMRSATFARGMSRTVDATPASQVQLSSIRPSVPAISRASGMSQRLLN
jgi:hypothetical protein